MNFNAALVLILFGAILFASSVYNIVKSPDIPIQAYFDCPFMLEVFDVATFIASPLFLVFVVIFLGSYHEPISVCAYLGDLFLMSLIPVDVKLDKSFLLGSPIKFVNKSI